MTSRRVLIATLIGVAATSTLSAAIAQALLSTFPARPVRIVVPFPAGGNSDAIARTIALQLSQIWKQPVLVDNKPGADTLIGTSDVVRSPADGHTILSNISLIVQNSFTKRMPFDTFKELKPLIAATETPMYFVVSRQERNATVPQTLDQFIRSAKAEPGAISFGSFGNGSTGHLLLLALQKSASIEITHVPFKGNSDVIVQLLNGQVSSSFLPYSAIAPHLPSGKIKVLAATGEQRPPLSPDIPTFEELGVKGFTSSQWNGFFISAKTPAAVAHQLSLDMNAAIRSPEVEAKLKALGLTPVGGTPERFQTMIDKDVDLIRAALKDGQIQSN